MHPHIDIGHCPTCGGEMDAHALMVLERNRNARDAQFRELAAALEPDGTSGRFVPDLRTGALALAALVLVAWMIWASASIAALRAAM